jgi:hypothetical protein
MHHQSSLRTLFVAVFLSVTSLLIAAVAKDLPPNRPIVVTGTITLEGKDNLFLTSSDTVNQDGTRYPIKHMAMWCMMDVQGANYKALLKAANTGKPVTLHGFFKWPQHGGDLVFAMNE